MSDLINRQNAINTALEFFVEFLGGAFHEDDQKILMKRMNELPSAEPEPHWIPCSKRLPEEDYWLGGSGKQFSDEVLVSVSNSADEDVYVYVSQTLDGKWNLELPEYYEVIAWMPLPSPYQPEEESE